MNNEFPSTCPMKKADYEHYCISDSKGTVTENGKCVKHNDCEKIVKDFKRMKVPTTSKIFSSLGGCK